MAVPRSLRPLRHTGFRQLVAGQLTSNLGDMCYAVALPWYVLAHHGGPLLLATVLAFYGVPRTVLVMMAADTARSAACNGFGNVIMITAFQHWAPPEALGRLMGVLMLASFGVFPLSVLLAGVVTRTLGAAAFFPLAAAPLAVAMIGALAVREWRQFQTPGSLELRPNG